MMSSGYIFKLFNYASIVRLRQAHLHLFVTEA